jgi:hypothetical protein
MYYTYGRTVNNLIRGMIMETTIITVRYENGKYYAYASNKDGTRRIETKMYESANLALRELCRILADKYFA